MQAALQLSEGFALQQFASLQQGVSANEDVCGVVAAGTGEAQPAK